MTPAPRLLFGRRMRLTKDREFRAVFAARVRKSHGPVTVYGRPNGLDVSRLGLSISRRVGNAVMRNRFKRLVREAFRLGQHDLPSGFDLIVVLRPHEARDLTFYREAMERCVREIAGVWAKRSARGASDDG
ncbi:MAG: ribonuclease P protein component [Phycisphaerales bacterium]